MLSFLKWLLPATAAMGLLVGMSALTVKAEDKPAPAGKGTVTGTVVDKDGKAVASAEVGLFKPPPPRRSNGAAGQARAVNQAEDPKPAPPQRRRPEALFKATTDADGKFTIKDVPAGQYSVATQVEGKGRGRARVNVTADGTAKVNLKLSDAPPGGRGGRAKPGNAQ